MRNGLSSQYPWLGATESHERKNSVGMTCNFTRLAKDLSQRPRQPTHVGTNVAK